MQDYQTLSAFYSHESALHGDSKVVGRVYTPNWIANQMVFMLVSNHLSLNADVNDNTFSRFTNDFLLYFPKDALQAPAIEPYEADWLLDQLLPLKILDLSCGSGVLLLSYLEFILRLIKRTLKYSLDDFEKIICNNIYGVDVDHQAIEIFNQLILSLLESQALSSIQTNLFNLDSLNDELPFEHESFDLIIGNPPYIGEKNNRDLFEAVKLQPWGKPYYEGKMDYFYFFIYKGYDYLKPNGSLCYLSSNYFLTADGAKKLRAFIKNHFFISRYCDYAQTTIFRNRRLHACQYVLQKKPAIEVINYSESMEFKKTFLPSNIFKSDGTMVFLLNDHIQTVLQQMEEQSIGRLGELYDVFQGIVSGYDAAFVTKINASETKLTEYYRPFYKNSDISDYLIQVLPSRQILYVDQPTDDEILLDHLKPFRERLERRREVIRHVRSWYMLTWPRETSIFVGEKVVVPQRASYNRFSYTDKPFFASADVYFIKLTERSPYPLKVLTVLLNSDPYHTWLKHMGKRKGELLELYATPLKNIPLPSFDEDTLHDFQTITNQIYAAIENQQFDKVPQLKSEINSIVNTFYKRK